MQSHKERALIIADSVGIEIYCKISFFEGKKMHQIMTKWHGHPCVGVGNIRRTEANAWRSAYAEMYNYHVGKKDLPILQKEVTIIYPEPIYYEGPAFILPKRDN